MAQIRRRIRNYLLDFIGVQGNMQIWWTPEMPVLYVGNPKAGCSSIKQSLKAAQADAYVRGGRNFTRVSSPHTDDDCLRRKGLLPRRCRERHIFSCVRNPYTRTLSGFLDKAARGDHLRYPELRRLRSITFENFLRAVADHDPLLLDVHFRPQHVNLNYPNVGYDAIFYLENSAPMASFLEGIIPHFELKRFSPHARGAQEKLAAHYDATTIDLVRRIYASDFERFFYSRDIADALQAPGCMIREGALLSSAADRPSPPAPARAERDTRTLENTLRCRWLTERGLL